MSVFLAGATAALVPPDRDFGSLTGDGVWMNLCLLLILVAVLLLRRRLHRAASEGEQVGARIVARLTPKVAIYRLKVSGEELLLGVSGEQVSLLARLNGMAQSHMSDKEAVPR